MGLVPASSSLKRFVKGNVAVVGDAARHTDPFSGAGINHAMYSGEMAAEAIIAGFDNGDVPRSLINNYEKPWRGSFTKRTDIYYKIRKVYRELTDKEMDAVTSTLVTLVKDMTEMSVTDIFPTLLKALVTTPSLITKTRHLVI
jgi:digeranylgeranylglycerophospholipid reductase